MSFLKKENTSTFEIKNNNKMTAQEAFNKLRPNEWAKTSIIKRLELIEQVQKNLNTYAEELGEADANMKNNLYPSFVRIIDAW